MVPNHTRYQLRYASFSAAQTALLLYYFFAISVKQNSAVKILFSVGFVAFVSRRRGFGFLCCKVCKRVNLGLFSRLFNSCHGLKKGLNENVVQVLGNLLDGKGGLLIVEEGQRLLAVRTLNDNFVLFGLYGSNR